VLPASQVLQRADGAAARQSEASAQVRPRVCCPRFLAAAPSCVSGTFWLSVCRSRREASPEYQGSAVCLYWLPPLRRQLSPGVLGTSYALGALCVLGMHACLMQTLTSLSFCLVLRSSFSVALLRGFRRVVAVLSLLCLGVPSPTALTHCLLRLPPRSFAQARCCCTRP
jgi:hypothetical protein